MRDFNEVARQIKELVPETETKFHEDLGWVIDDAFYKAPEETLQWHRCFGVIQRHVPKPREDWEIKMWSIFSLVPEDEIREQINEAP